MPVHIIAELFDHIPSTTALFYLVLGVTAILYLRAWSAGRASTRDRDMHGRTVLLVGGFTPTGLSILTELATRGAQVVAVTPHLSDSIPQLIIPALRSTTGNELLFTEECDMESPASIQAFCTQLIKASNGTGANSDPPRLDAIVFVHEYAHVGAYRASRAQRSKDGAAREAGSLGTFKMATTLLPLLLRAPPERDIRIVNVVNPFYAAAVTSFDPTTPLKPSDGKPVSQMEGDRSLRSIVFARHLQRVLDVLAAPPVPPTTDETSMQVPAAPPKGSNITSVTACPGFSRWETIAPLCGAATHSLIGILVYMLLYPILFVFAKSASAASQSPLYTLFMPTALKSRDANVPTIKGGSLYRECEVTQIPTQHGLLLMNDESIGRAVWESYEKGVEAWQRHEEEVLKEAVARDLDSKEPETAPSSASDSKKQS